MIAHPKPSQVKRRKTASRDLKDYYGFTAAKPCCAPDCNAPSEVAHVGGVLSGKTGLPLPRRLGPAAYAVVPACASHHRGHQSIHALGERGFEVAVGWPDGQLIRLALTNLAEYMENGGE